MARQVVVDIIGDSSKFSKTLDTAGASSTKFGATIGVVSGVVSGFTTKLIDSVGGAASEIIDLGPKMEALDAKSKTVFGGSLGTVQKWADTNARAMGLTSREAVGLAAGMGDLLIPMGFTRDAAAGMATDVVGLSGALSEWSGGTRSAAEVTDILQKGLLGERDGLKALGISISDADVQSQLLKDGTDKLTGSALEQAKANATLTLYMAKTTDAQAAYAAGTAKGIREQHQMDAQLQTVKETIAKGLYPILRTVGAFIAENLPKAIHFLGEAWTNIGPIIRTVGGVLLSIGKTVMPIIVTAVGLMVDAFKVAWPIINTIATNIGNAFTTVTGVIKAAINGVISIINAVIRGINAIQVHIEVGPVKYDFDGLNIGYLPTLHAGGIVPGVTGSEVPVMLQAGEMVTPAGKASGGGLTIIIQGPIYGGPAGLDQLAADLLSRMRLTEN